MIKNPVIMEELCRKYQKDLQKFWKVIVKLILGSIIFQGKNLYSSKFESYVDLRREPLRTDFQNHLYDLPKKALPLSHFQLPCRKIHSTY